MGCNNPLVGFYSRDVNKSGLRSLVFSHSASHSGVAVRVPCGQCIGCRLERARQWAVRLMHEKRLHKESVFLTLTYDDDHCPNGLVKRDFQLFMKRLRKSYDAPLRYYACGEYGENTFRPHYHAIVFGLLLVDRGRTTSDGYYSSDLISKAWPFGQHTCGEVTFRSCAYVARYVCGKVTGSNSEAHYHGRCPEFALMSRRPGIGAGWFDKYGRETYLHDSVVIEGREVRPPRFYDSLNDKVDSSRMVEVRRMRRRRAMLAMDDNTVDRRRVKEQLARLKLLRFERDVR